MPDTFVAVNEILNLTIALSEQERVPVMYPYPHMTKAGGLISYGVDGVDLYRRSAQYVNRILKGTQPNDLPVQLPTKFDLTVNLGAARKLGLAVSPGLLARADEVIE